MPTTTVKSTNQITDVLKRLGVEDLNSGVSTGNTWLKGEGVELKSFSPVDGALIATVRGANNTEYEKRVTKAQEGFP